MRISSIFKKNDFILCDVPVPIGYPQSQTHAGISYVPSKLNGYSYWLVSSPFPNKKPNRLIIIIKKALKSILLKNISIKTKNNNNKVTGEDYENPMLYFANETEKGEPPIKFIPFRDNPLMDKPKDIYGGGTYCSDPDIFIENSDVYILNRETFRRYYFKEKNQYSSYTRINLLHGKVVDSEFKIINIDTKFTEIDLAGSPCIINFNDKYHYIYLITNSYNDGKDIGKLVIRSDNTIEGRFESKKIARVDGGNFIPWHLSVFQHNGTLYSVVACIIKGNKRRCYQMLGEFDNNLDTLKIYQIPLTNLNSYRGSAFVREDGEFILYSTTVFEKFTGSKSIDGREIIVAHKKFDLILKELQNK